MNMYKAIALGMYLMGWFARAASDGKITQEEIGEAVTNCVRVVGIDVNIELPLIKK